MAEYELHLSAAEVDALRKLTSDTLRSPFLMETRFPTVKQRRAATSVGQKVRDLAATASQIAPR